MAKMHNTYKLSLKCPFTVASTVIGAVEPAILLALKIGRRQLKVAKTKPRRKWGWDSTLYSYGGKSNGPTSWETRR